MALRSTAYSKSRITSATTTQVKEGQGVLKRIVVSVPVSTGTITVYDNHTADTSNPLAVITSTADLKPYVIEIDCRMSNGIKLVTTQAQDILVIYE